MTKLTTSQRGKTEAFLIDLRALRSQAAKAGLRTDLLDKMREQLENATDDPDNAREHVNAALNERLPEG